VGNAPSWVLLMVGLFGGGSGVGIARLILGRAKAAAETESIRIGALDQVVQTLSRRVDDLTKEVGRLEGRLDRTEAERDYWRTYAQQLAAFIRDVARMEVPHPVAPVEEP